MKLTLFEKIALLINIPLLIFQLMLMGSVPSFFEFSILNLFVPAIVLVNVGFFFYWLLKMKGVFLLFMITFLIGYGEWGLLYQFPRTAERKDANTFKVMNYNVRLFNRYGWIKEVDVPKRMQNFVDQEQPDIICLQEYSKKEAPEFSSYPYRYIQPIQSNGKSGVAILSKFPIINSGYINFANSSNSGIFSDIEYRGKKARIYNLHLESLRIDLQDTLITKVNSERLKLKFNQVFKKQLEQIKQFQEIDKENNYPSIICTDLNNSQFSKIYRLLRKNHLFSLILLFFLKMILLGLFFTFKY